MTDTHRLRRATSAVSPREAISFEDSPAFPWLFFGFLALALLFLFRDFVFSSQMLAGSDMINAGVYFRSLLVNHVKEYGSIPMWNPYIFGGMPYVDAFHGDIFYPLSIVKYAGDIFRALGWSLILNIYLAGIFMYAAARQFKLSRLSAALSACAYMFSGYLISLVAPGHDGKIFVTALFPLAMLFLDRAFERNPILNFALLGTVIGCIILSPHPQMSYFTLWAVALYGLYLLIADLRARKGMARIFSQGALLTGAVVLGLGISAIQFYPGYKYTKEFSPRADTKKGWEWATSWSLHTEDVVGLVAPEFSGTKVNNEKYPDVYYWGKNPFKDNSEYAGVIALFLALVGACFYRRKGLFFAGLGLFALSYALADTTPLFKLYFHLIPNVQSLRAASMIMFLFLFSTSLLAGMGIEWLRREYSAASTKTRANCERYLWGSVAFLGLLAILWSAAGEGMLDAYRGLFYSDLKTISLGQQNLTKWDVALANLPSVKSGFWISFLWVGTVATILWLTIRKKAPQALLLVIPLLTACDGIRFGSRFIETFDQGRHFGANAITNFLTQQPGTHRVFNGRVFGGDYLPYYGIEIVDGYHGNQLRWYDDLLGGMALSNLINPRFLNLVGARYLVVPAEAAFPPAYFGDATLVEVANFGQAKILENPNYFPRAFLVDTLIKKTDRKEIYPELLTTSVNLRQVGFVEDIPTGWSNVTPVAGASDSVVSLTDSAWVTVTGMDSIAIGYTSDAPRALVVTTSYYDAWIAYMGETELPVFRINGAFLGVIAPAGTGTITFRYKSARYETGKTISLASGAVAGLLIGLGLWRARRRPQRQMTTVRE